MPIPTPFHQRTRELCTSLFWKDWAGYYTVRSYDTGHEKEYHAIRQAAGLIDVTPQFKYEVHGPQAGELLARVMVRDVRKLKVGRCTYLCWCDDDGKVVDNGTVSRLDKDYYRVTAAEPTFSWLVRHARAYDVIVEDSSLKMGTLAVQGPRSRELLVDCAGVEIGALEFFGVTRAEIAGAKVWISRTGYTGDLGYEIWADTEDAVQVYDAVYAAGQAYGALPAGIDAMDVTRVEAGFLMNGVDYYSAHQCMIESHKSTPFELGLGWTVELDREPFIGQAALRAEKERGSVLAFVGLVYDWDELEALFASIGLPPQVPSGAHRDAIPVYARDGQQVGRATTRAWSPILEKLLALATVQAEFSDVGTELEIEVTVEWERRRITAVVSETPFFNPRRKRDP